ncbi:MAG: septum formation initiator family protein [Mangrovibacterium sp.]
MQKYVPSAFRNTGREVFLVAVLFALWIGFFDEYNLVGHIRNQRKLSQLIEQQEYLKEKIGSDQRKIRELHTNLENLEKFAREQFLMKKGNEELFVIVEMETD